MDGLVDDLGAMSMWTPPPTRAAPTTSNSAVAALAVAPLVSQQPTFSAASPAAAAAAVSAPTYGVSGTPAVFTSHRPADRLELSKRLAKHGILNPFSFMETLTKAGAVVTGGFALQFYLGETWERSDLDIACPPATAEQVRAFIVSSAGFGAPWMRNLHDRPEYANDTGFAQYITRVVKYGFGPQGHERYVDLINVTNVIAYINAFDLTCCQVALDEQGTYVWYPEPTRRKLCFVNRPPGRKPISRLEERIEKYQRRGFTCFSTENQMINAMMNGETPHRSESMQFGAQAPAEPSQSAAAAAAEKPSKDDAMSS